MLIGAALIGAGAVLAFQFLTASFERPRLSPPPAAERPPLAYVEPGPAKAPQGPDFFGFPLNRTERAARPSELMRFVPMQGRCAAGFDATSTLHDFSGSTTAITGHIEFEKGRHESTAKAEIVVDARTLDTGNKDRDQDMHETTLESAKYPEVRFVLTSVAMKTPGALSGDLTMRGTIEIHGVKREVEIPAVGELREDGYLHGKGQFKALLTDFGMTPPTKLGFIKVRDEIVIWFELWAEPE
jgi:polyisoprenoid-binding protein YceI